MALNKNNTFEDLIRETGIIQNDYHSQKRIKENKKNCITNKNVKKWQI